MWLHIFKVKFKVKILNAKVTVLKSLKQRNKIHCLTDTWVSFSDYHYSCCRCKTFTYSSCFPPKILIMIYQRQFQPKFNQTWHKTHPLVLKIQVCDWNAKPYLSSKGSTEINDENTLTFSNVFLKYDPGVN